jgi:hypothetical protein
MNLSIKRRKRKLYYAINRGGDMNKTHTFVSHFSAAVAGPS